MTAARVSRTAVEVLSVNETPAVRVSRTATEVLSVNEAPAARVSRTAVEVLHVGLPQVRSTQLVVEVVALALPTVRSTQLVVEVVANDPAFAPPAQPQNPAAAALGDTSIRVTWDDVADETSYRVDRSPNGTTGWTDVSGALAAGTVLFDDTGLTAGTTYFYRVVAINANGETPSAVVSATTTGGPTPPSGGGNRMGGAGAIRRSPRTGGR